MNTDITVALIALVGTASGSITGVLLANRLTMYRISQLEKKMDKHNSLMERIYKLEEKVCNLTDDVARK